MSVEAISWAFKCPIESSTAKFVLVAFANCADGKEFLAWPSAAYLSEVTGQNRKTVLKNIQILIAAGYLQDTGARTGATGQVIVYRLVNPDRETFANGPKNGTVSEESQIYAQRVPNLRAKSPKNGTRNRQEPSKNQIQKNEAEDFQKRKAILPSLIPDGWSPNAEHLARCNELGLDGQKLATGDNGFVNYHRAKGSLLCDWDAAFNYWIGVAADKKGRTSTTPAVRQGDMPALSIPETLQAALEHSGISKGDVRIFFSDVVYVDDERKLLFKSDFKLQHTLSRYRDNIVAALGFEPTYGVVA